MPAICGKGKGTDTTGATNNGLLLNTLKTLFKLSRILFRSQEMHSKWHHKIFICLVILGKLEVFLKLQRLQYYFAENFRCNLKLYEGENFFDSSLPDFFKSENARFLFPRNIA